ncbi:MAG: Sapep family Mn(2+)-dependent dipeptidase [Firmicutes bacterium]|nr:Sapep family Mn(2+)-dependent dipeptidase [Bacillota bacterium]
MENTNYEASVTALRKLLMIDTSSVPPLEGMPFGEGNATALNFTLDLLKGFGFKTKNIDNYCGWAEIGEGELFGVLAHLDTVPAGVGWTYPPFGAEIHNGRIYARGAEDDKGPLVAVIYAVARILAGGKKPKMRLRFILGCNEESGWKCMDRYKETEEMPQLGFSPDSDFPVINCEKGVLRHKISFPLPPEIRDISGGEQANIVPDYATATLKCGKTIEARGKSAHGSRPKEGENAIIKLLSSLISEEKAENLTKLHSALKNSDGEGVNLKLSDSKSGALTINLGVISAENGTITIKTDIRYPVSFKKEEITARLAEALPFCTVSEGAHNPPLYVPPNHPLVLGLLSAYSEVTGDTASTPLAIGGATYARVLPLGVSFGPVFPSEPSTVHAKDENISLGNFKKLQEIYQKALEKLCF